MAIKCFRCGTMYNGIECPTCKQRKLSEERNRLLKEQNELSEKQVRESEKQTRIAEEEQAQREQERFEQQLEIEREENREEFNSRVDELSNYADERNLMPAFVCFQYSNIGNSVPDEIDLTTIKEWGEAGISYYSNSIGNIIEEKCLREFNKLIRDLDSDDRVIDGGKYGMCFNPKIKLGLIKQIANSHSTDYVILPLQSDQSLLIFPTNLAVDNSLTKGYENKEIPIGEFQYMMFLHDADEAKRITKILSDATKRIHFVIEEVKKIISDYITNNPKPQPVKRKERKSGAGILAIICVIIGVIAGYFIGNLLGGSVIYFFSCGGGFVVGLKIGGFIGDKIDKRAEDKTWQQYRMNEEIWQKSLSDWASNLNKIINEHIQKQSFNDVAGKFLLVDSKKDTE